MSHSESELTYGSDDEYVEDHPDATFEVPRGQSGRDVDHTHAEEVRVTLSAFSASNWASNHVRAGRCMRSRCNASEDVCTPC